MISLGKNIRDSQDALQKLPVDRLAALIKDSNPEVISMLRQLRIIQQLNPVQYGNTKKMLPYFVCAIFNPSYRKTENFAFTEYFIVDIDHISEKGYIIDELRRTLCSDSRTMMCFVSPSGDGLKIILRLRERCYDAMLYKIFYRLFIERFALQYGIQQVVDARTCDVTRACFICHDENLYYNPDSEKVNIKDYIDQDTNIQQALSLKKEVERSVAKEISEMNETAVESKDPDLEIINAIKHRLNPKSKNRNQKAVYVPEELNSIMNDLTTHIESLNICIEEIIDISYGKKMRFKIGQKRAEINLFYGKRGFKVVQSPRTGTDQELNTLMADVIETFIDENT